MRKPLLVSRFTHLGEGQCRYGSLLLRIGYSRCLLSRNFRGHHAFLQRQSLHIKVTNGNHQYSNQRELGDTDKGETIAHVEK